MTPEGDRRHPGRSRRRGPGLYSYGVWHDEDGEESEVSGALPDPGARHWRHPSELGSQHALPHPDPTPVPSRSLSSGVSALRPALVVSGCVVIAVAGLAGLQRIDRTSPLDTEAIGTVIPTPTTAAIDRVFTLVSERPVPGGEAVASEADPAGDPAPTTTTSAPAETSSTLGRPIDGREEPPGAPAEGSVAIEAEVAPVYGIYRNRSDDGRLGSFLVVDGQVVTSASALDGRAAVWVRVASDWFGATVVASDPLTDVALLELGTDAAPALPVHELRAEPVRPGDPVMVGHGDPGSHRSTTDASGDTGTLGRQTTAAGPGPETTLPPDGSADEGTSDPSGDVPSTVDQATSEDTTDDPATGPARPTPGLSDEAWVAESHQRGLVYSMSKPLQTPSGRKIHDPILVLIDRRPGDAGGPLRDRDGRVVGLTVPGHKPQLAAVPILRVIEAVDLLRAGALDTTWLGIEVEAEQDDAGLVVTGVDEASPVPYLLAGDRIVAVNGRPATHVDDLRFAARTTGVGGVLTLTFQRTKVQVTVDVVVAPAPVGV